MTDVRWDLLQPVDIGGRFQQGYQNALAVREHSQDRQLQMEQMQIQRAQQQQQQQTQLTERHRNDIRLGARIVRQINPTDDATWQRARLAAQQAGVDVTEVPTSFDPNYVQQLLTAGQQLDSLDGGYTLDEGAVRYDGGNNVVARGGPRQPRYYPVPPGGRLELDPSYQGPTTDNAGSPSQPHAPPTVPPGTTESYNGRQYRLGPSGAWEDIGPASGGAVPTGSTDLTNWNNAGRPGPGGPGTFR